MRHWLGILGLLLVFAGPLAARTITLTGEDCDQMAVLSAKAPRLGWAAQQVTTAAYNNEPSVQLFDDMAILLRFPLDKIAKGQRITKAELTMSGEYVAGVPLTISVRRILADWGHGVCHRYRRTYPKMEEWTTPGCRGASTDRANKDSGVLRFTVVGSQTVDVTEDIELWYTGGSANRGWVLILDSPGAAAYLPSPYTAGGGGSKQWKLQKTFEPQ
jgi:hypothetical protein